MGKSSLFNNLIGSRKSIIYNQPGVTRDLITEKVKWGQGNWTLTDFPGFENEKAIRNDPLTLAAIRSAEKQLEKFNLLLFVVKRGGLTTYEQEYFAHRCKSKKPVWLVVNFIDDPQLEAEASEFYELGFAETFFVSALNHRNISELRERIQLQFKNKKRWMNPPKRQMNSSLQRHPMARPPDLKLAILGKPNAGKSTLFNTFTGKERALISPVAGMMRDTINEFFHFEGKLIEVVDTAGLRLTATSSKTLNQSASSARKKHSKPAMSCFS